MIKKIKSIKNMAVFENFDWDKTVKENDKSIMKFSHINIFYGRNYSGKTTISRIFRALETGELSDKYSNPEFIVEMEDNTTVTRNYLKNHQQLIRVLMKILLEKIYVLLPIQTKISQPLLLLAVKIIPLN